MDLESVSLDSEFRGTPLHSSLSFISVQSLSSARGSTPLTKRRKDRTYIEDGRRYYDATKPMENDYEVPLHRLQCLRGLQNSGILQIGNKDTDTKTRRVLEDYFKTSSHSTNSTKPRKEFPSLRSRSKPFSNLKQKQIELYLQNEQYRAHKTEIGRKSVSFAISGNKRPITENVKLKRPITENVTLKRPPVTVLQQNGKESNIARPYSDKLLLRRPVTKTSQSLTVDDDLFISIASSVQLKPLNFKSSNDQYLFYTQNYPLLLDAHAEEKKIIKKRTPTPETMEGADLKRALQLNTRMTELESSLETLDKETEDVDFRTVLRDDVFYPNRWPWNEKKSSGHDIAESPLAK